MDQDVGPRLTRRKSLQLLGASLSGALLTLGLPRSWAAAATGGKGCGQICAPLFNPRNQAAFESCSNACEDCKSCQGTPTMTSTQVLVCNNATPCRSASGLACCQSGQNCCGGGVLLRRLLRGHVPAALLCGIHT